MISIVPVTLITGISNHVYAMGNYRATLIIGVASSLPRTVLYFILVPALGDIGAALSFTIGSFAGLLTSCIIARETELKIHWKQYLFICAIPVLISYVFSSFSFNYGISILVAITLSYMVYVKAHIMTQADVHDALTLLPSSFAGPTAKAIDFVARKIDRTY